MTPVSAQDMSAARKMRAILMRARAEIWALGEPVAIWPTRGWDLDSTLDTLTDMMPEVDTTDAWARLERAAADKLVGVDA